MRQWRCRVAALCAAAMVASGAAAQESETREMASGERIRALEARVEELREELEAVRAELARLEREREKAAREAERERLRREALAEAGTARAPSEVEPATRFVSGTRMQPQLNPEISVTGNTFLVGGNHQREELQGGELEVDLRSYLDPYSRMHLVVSHALPAHGPTFGLPPGTDTYREGGTEVEEAYVTWLHLPGGMDLTVGRKRQQFGVVNRWHRHALDQADLPRALQESFGEEGLSGTGLFLHWLLPRLWADANQLTVEITDGDDEVAFAGSDWRHPSSLARLSSYWDLTGNAYLEIGLDALHGSADRDGHLRHDFHALDLAYDWYPAGRERYRELTVRGMVLRSRLELPQGGRRIAWGGFLYGQMKLSSRWIAGLRYDRVDDQREAGHRYWGLTPYVTFWQSEFVRLRAQASYRRDGRFGTDRRYQLQITFAAGPHKHESY